MTLGLGHARPGRALLEVLAALALLAIVAPAVLRLMADATTTVARVADAATIDHEAAQLLDAAATWTRPDLQRRLGARRQGAVRLEITQVSSSLFLLVVRDTLGRDLRWRTALYRPVLRDAS